MTWPSFSKIDLLYEKKYKLITKEILVIDWDLCWRPTRVYHSWTLHLQLMYWPPHNLGYSTLRCYFQYCNGAVSFFSTTLWRLFWSPWDWRYNSLQRNTWIWLAHIFPIQLCWLLFEVVRRQWLVYSSITIYLITEFMTVHNCTKVQKMLYVLIKKDIFWNLL